MSYAIITILDDEITAWRFNTRDEAGKFEDKVKKLNPDITIHYEKQFDTYTVDEAFDELKRWYGLEDDEEEDDDDTDDEQEWPSCYKCGIGIVRDSEIHDNCIVINDDCDVVCPDCKIHYKDDDDEEDDD